jgi:hypothetical protein
MADSLSMALLVLLETLSPIERAVFLLREVFDYGYDEIAPVVGKSEANCRQIAARARRHIESRKPRFEASRRRREDLAHRFLEAVGQGDTEGLIRLLAADVVAYADGGGKTQTFTRPVYGRERIARLLPGFGTWLELLGAEEMRLAEVNGQPGALFLGHDGGPSWSSRSTSPTDWSRPSAPSPIPRSCATSTRWPVAPGRLLAELGPRLLRLRTAGPLSVMWLGRRRDVTREGPALS